jgi:hypothetical protein
LRTIARRAVTLANTVTAMGFREKIVVGAVLALILAAMLLSRDFYSPNCTTRIVETSAALNKSYGELQAARSAGKSLCAAYRHHVQVLEAAVPVAALCGPGQMNPRTSDHPESELGAYRRLVAEQCAP